MVNGILCFNPRTRVGCDTRLSIDIYMDSVSIHAPVWGATAFIASLKLLNWFQSTHPCGVRHGVSFISTSDCVSIHAPVWGATHAVISKIKFKRVSIHAPVWGATIFWDAVIYTNGFNPRTRVGCDDAVIKPLTLVEFQSTHPCGVRLPALRLCSSISSFNPRTRVGCDCRYWRTHLM